MSTPRIDVTNAERLARVKLSIAIEPGDLRVTCLVSELGAEKVLDYLEATGAVPVGPRPAPDRAGRRRPTVRPQPPVPVDNPISVRTHT